MIHHKLLKIFLQDATYLIFRYINRKTIIKMLTCRTYPCRCCFPVFLLRVDLDILRYLSALGNNPWLNRYCQLRWFIMMFESVNVASFSNILTCTLFQYPYWYLSWLYIPFRFFPLIPHKWLLRLNLSYRTLAILVAASYVLGQVFLVISVAFLPYFIVIPLVLLFILYQFGLHLCLAHCCPSCYYWCFYVTLEDLRRRYNTCWRICFYCCPEGVCNPPECLAIDRV